MSIGQTDKARKGSKKGGKGGCEINCLCHTIIMSAWLLNCPVGPVCAERMLKSISAAADTATVEEGGIYADFTFFLRLTALLSDGHC